MTESQTKPSIASNLKSIGPAKWFSFGFAMLVSVLAIFYGLVFGFFDHPDNTNTAVDVIHGNPFEPGLSATPEHEALMTEHYEEQRQKAEEQGVTAVPPIPFNSEEPQYDTEPETVDFNDIALVDEIPFPEDPEPPRLDLSKFAAPSTPWTPKQPEASAVDYSAANNDAYEAKVNRKVEAIATLVESFNDDKDIGHQPQNGSYWQSQTATDSQSSDLASMPSARAAIAATSRFMCRTTHAVNTDLSTVSIVEAECMSGIMKGGKIQGAFTQSGETLPLEFTSFHKNGYTIPIRGYAIDPKTQVVGLATDVKKHTLSRHLALASSSFLEGIGSLLDNTRISVNSDTVVAEASYDTNDRLVQGVNKIGNRYASKAEAYFDRAPTVMIKKHQPFILMVVDDVPAQLVPPDLANR